MAAASIDETALRLRDLRRDPLGALARLRGDLVRLRVGPRLLNRRVLLVNAPAAVVHVLKDRADDYRKGPTYDAARSILGTGLLTVDGEEWAAQRRRVQPRFARFGLDPVAAISSEETAVTVAEWRRAAERGEPVDAAREAAALVHRITCRVFFGVPAERTAALLDSLHDAIDGVHAESTSVLPALARLRPSWVAARARLRAAAADLLCRAREAGAAGLLGDHLAPRADPAEERQLGHEVMTFLLAGLETTSSAIAWTLHHVARNPAVQDRIHAALEASPGEEAAADGPLSRTIQESLRLHPPGWIIERVARADDVLLGSPVPRGSVLWIVTYLIHRRPEFWPDPERFDPDRFAPGNLPARPEGCYLPFGLGAHACIGRQVSLAETSRALAGILRAFELRTAGPDRPEVEPRAFSLRPRHGLPLALSPRGSAASRNAAIRGTTVPPESSRT